MSYARWGCHGSEVYVFVSEQGFVTMIDDDEFLDASAEDCALRLETIAATGRVVPQSAIDAVRGSVFMPPNVGGNRLAPTQE